MRAGYHARRALWTARELEFGHRVSFSELRAAGLVLSGCSYNIPTLAEPAPRQSNAPPGPVRVFWLVCGLAMLVLALGLGVRLRRAERSDTGVFATVGLSGASEAFAGRPLHYRVVARDRRTGQALADERVELVWLDDEDRVHALGEGKTDATGVKAFDVELPASKHWRLRAWLPKRGSDANDELYVSGAGIPVTFVSSDKPLYQPGQTIHFRALTLASGERPLQGMEAALEVYDPSGTKVWKKVEKTSEFGIVHGDFHLADEVGLGTYTLKVSLGPFTNEHEVEVKRYALPKLKAELELDSDLIEPGGRLAGTVTARYSFGEPAVTATVNVRSGDERLLARGVTDAAGRFHFEIVTDSDAPVVAVQASVQTTPGLSAEVEAEVAVARELEVEVFPENGALVPGVENQLWIVTSVAGRPRAAEVRLEPGGAKVTTSENGLSRVTFTPSQAGPELVVHARDQRGLEVERLVHRSSSDPALLVRPGAVVLEPKKPARVEVFAANNARGDVLLSLWKGERLLATAQGVLSAGRAQLSLPVPAAAHGLLRLEAEAFPGGAASVRGQALALAEPGGRLKVKADFDRPSYQPGDMARLALAVQRSDGTPLRAALGVSAVDEAVFALSEVRPDLEQRFFGIDQELGDPAAGRARFANFVGARQPGVLDSKDPTQGDARGVALAVLAEGTPQRPSSVSFDAAEIVVLKERQKERLLAWAGLAPWVLGSILLVWFLVYALYRSVRPMEPTLVDERNRRSWLRGARAMSSTWAMAVLLPILVGVLTDIYLRPPHAAGRHIRTALTWLLCAALFALLQVVQLRRLRKQAVLSLHPGYSFALGLLPAAILLLQAGAALSLGFHLRPDVQWLSGDRFVVVLLAGVIVAQLVFGLLALLQQSALASLTAGRRAWLVVSRACLLGLPLSLWVFVEVSRQGFQHWANSRFVFEDDQAEVSTAGKAGNRRYGVAGPRGQAATTTHRSAPGRLRSHFPETLLWQPELVTDAQGKASLQLPLADSIATYRVGISAVGRDGELASAVVPLQVQQDFFVDVSLPATLTQGDEVGAPVTVYNYLDEPQAVTLHLEGDGLVPLGKAEQALTLGAREVRGLRLRLRAESAGEHFVKVSAQGARVSDSVQRATKVLPRGVAVVTTFAGRLAPAASADVLIPPEAIPGSAELYAKIYAGSVSQLVETLDGALQRPHGCFEQASSTTYPNVLVLAFLQKSGASSPAVQAKALGYIEEGYQQLVTFKTASGGFAWFPDSDPSVLLTAYALQEFTDMNRVWPVDADMIAAARTWLLGQQRADGSFSSGDDRLRVAAYVVRALSEAGEKNAQLVRALDFVAAAPPPDDAYGLALVATALLRGERRDKAEPLLQKLAGLAQKSGEQSFWTAGDESLWSGKGQGYTVEITGLAAYAFGLAEKQPELRQQALVYLAAQRLQDGTWPSTAATIAALLALLQAAKPSDAADQRVSVTVAGAPAGEISVPRATRDAHRVFGLSDKLVPGVNRVALASSVPGDLAYQLVSTYYVPSERAAVAQSRGPLAIQARYSTVVVPVGSVIDCEVEVRWKEDRPRKLGIIEIAIPPGFDAETNELEARERGGQVLWFNREHEKLVVYVDEFSSLDPVHVRYRLRALHPVKALAPAIVVYPYYQPELRAETRPIPLTAQ